MATGGTVVPNEKSKSSALFRILPLLLTHPSSLKVPILDSSASFCSLSSKSKKLDCSFSNSLSCTATIRPQLLEGWVSKEQWKNLPKNARFRYSNYGFSQTSQLLDLGSLQTSQSARKLKLLVCCRCWFIALCIHFAFELLSTSRYTNFCLKGTQKQPMKSKLPYKKCKIVLQC
ncbi:hypothetical protein DVH24_027725 [Malus domestica]|uniref:Uncharacterized protein n=1 Tax=Malus domestica TaxID=3750 RepID=A0A498H858_MALDO|nr:hypothetical protein DVH24_027725 [Malus domestica]